MGYFNIFYKITRVIDMLTRKRNRKAIMVILIIITVVFIYHNKVNAQEDDLQYNQRFTHSHIRLNSDGTVQYGTINTTSMYYSLIFPVKEGFTYKGSCTSSPSDAPLKVGFVSDLDNMVYSMNTTEGSTTINYGPGAVSIYGIYNALSGFEITADSDGYFIIGGFRPSGSAISYQDCGFQVYTNYNGESNLNTINQDLIRIEDLLKDYLYGDKNLFEVSKKTISLFPSGNSMTFTQGGQYDLVYYFRVREGQSYNFTFNTLRENVDMYYCRHGYIDNIPYLGAPLSSINYGYGSENNNKVTITATKDSYYYIFINTGYLALTSVNSTYNEGQEQGLYGGLTNIDTQVQDQAQQTRETITNTDIPTNEMSIDTSIVDGVSNTDNDNFLVSIINKFQGVISPSATVTTITIPIPKTGKNIVLRSDLLSRHVANTVIGTYITVFWYVVFFIYFFKFAYRVINWIVTGEIIEKPSAFMKYLMEQNAIITASMM